MSALDDIRKKNPSERTVAEQLFLSCGYMTISDVKREQAAAELAQLRAQIDEAIAWHEGEDSPHAEMERQIVALKHAVRNAYKLLDDDHVEAAWAVLQTAIDTMPFVEGVK